MKRQDTVIETRLGGAFDWKDIFKRFQYACSAGWWWELSGMVLSLVSCLVIAIVLSSYGGKPLSSWPYPVAPNTLLSIFVTVSKIALLLTVSGCISQLKWIYFDHGTQCIHDVQRFDDASRGPWGSLTLLLNLKLKDVLFRYGSGARLAALGAIITIATLAVDPFAQQVLHSANQESSADIGNIGLPVTTIMDTGRILDPPVGSNCSGTLCALRGRLRW